MSALRSAVDEYLAVPPAELADARLEEDFAELQRASEALDAARLRVLAEIDRRKPYRRDGIVSTVAWLVACFGVAASWARAQVGLARSLSEMPRTFEAVAGGDLTGAAARLLAAGRDAHPAQFAEDEPALVDAAASVGASHVAGLVSSWRLALDQAGSADGEESLRSRRRLHASRTLYGMVRIDGDLDPESGEAFLTALGALYEVDLRASPPGASDPRSPAERRADALTELSRFYLDRADRPMVGGERPHLTVTVDAAALGSGGVAVLDQSGPVTAAVARRLGCDASLTRVVLGPRSEPLDVGRRTHVVPPAMRRAVAMRDRGCSFPRCGRPSSWCDAHHVRHWADGGETALGNLALLCRAHHRLIHRGEFDVEMTHGRPTFRRKDGSMLEDRAPP